MKEVAAINSKQTGFTLVELVMVIVLIGMLSYGAASLFFSRDAYSGFIAKDQLISQALLAQQVALGMSAGVAEPVTLTVAVSGGNWVFTIDKAGVADPEPVIVDATSNSLIIDGATIGSGGSRTFTWNTQANLVSASNHEIRFVGERTDRVCLSSAGFAYESQATCP